MESTFGAPDAKAKEAVSVPAILLMIAALVGLVFGLLGMALLNERTLQEVLATENLPSQWRKDLMNSRENLAAGRLFYGLQAVLSGLVFFGALMMKRLQSRGVAVTGAIIACLPVCGPCFGCLSIPLGIWSLFVLFQPEVRQAFR